MVAFMVALSSEYSEKSAVFGTLETALFLVMMPKNEAKKEGELQKEEKMIISQMEQVLANFLYLKKTNMFQEPASVAMEIASQTGSTDISFYVSVPKYLESVFEKYVQGVYPRAIVDKVPQDYTIFHPQSFTAGAYLKLKENALFPISTYHKLEKDPLSTITNNLSKILPTEGAAVQVIIRPLSGFNLRKKGEKALLKIREGKSVRSAVSEAFQHPVMALIADITKDVMDPANKKKDAASPQKKEQGFDQVGYDAIQEKIQKQPFEANIRVIASAHEKGRAEEIAHHLAGAFNQFSLSAINSFDAKPVSEKYLKKF
ncbi:MAG TPA: hypothetical protein VI937_00535, partial [Negativicutes bacterium]|nr:hypothetical protein [Negativicutes bacterium]